MSGSVSAVAEGLRLESGCSVESRDFRCEEGSEVLPGGLLKFEGFGSGAVTCCPPSSLGGFSLPGWSSAVICGPACRKPAPRCWGLRVGGSPAPLLRCTRASSLR